MNQHRQAFSSREAMYLKIVLTLLMLATAALAIVMAQPTPRLSQPYPNDAILNAQVDHLELTSVTFQQIVEKLSEKTHRKIVVDLPSVESAGLDLYAQHDIVFDGVTLMDALDDARRLCTPYDGPLQFDVTADGSLRIFSGAGTTTRLRVYDVGDLLTDEYWGTQSSPGEAQANIERRLTSLTAFVSSAIGDSGAFSVVGSVRAFGKTLIINETPATLHQIENLLAWLRRLR